MSQRVLLGAAGALLLGSGTLLVGYFATGTDAVASEATVEPVPEPVAAKTPVAKGEVELQLEDRQVRIKWADLGEIGPDGGITALDEDKTVAALVTLKSTLDRAPQNARMDLEQRALVDDVPGYGVDVYGSVAALRTAIALGKDTVVLPGAALPADVTSASLGNIDIGTVLGHFTTKFSVGEKSRNYNLKLAASKLNGYILMPGVEFSFNDVVGARTEKEGYKIAHVITAGEMVDGLAGGTCQISTTLHGASFFSGLEIVRSIPHSRPSTYVHMGLDATVVYPVTDLRLRNPYDFPVVIHYRVARGESVVEILGKERPYDKIAFEREILEELPFDTVTREDDEVRMGNMVIEQEGFPGYKMKRYRKYYKDGKVVKTDTWNLRYRPVTEYARLGTNPDPTIKPPKQPKGHGPRPPKNKTFRLAQ